MILWGLTFQCFCVYNIFFGSWWDSKFFKGSDFRYSWLCRVYGYIWLVEKMCDVSIPMCLQWWIGDYNSNNWCVVRWMALLSEIYAFLNLTVWWLLRDIEDSISAFYNEQFIWYKIIFIWLVVLASVTRKDSKKECVFTFKVEDFKVKGMLTKEPEEGKFMLTSSNARWVCIVSGLFIIL